MLGSVTNRSGSVAAIQDALYKEARAPIATGATEAEAEAHV
jgi:hypothetical protein